MGNIGSAMSSSKRAAREGKNAREHQPSILAGVVDQQGRRWVTYGTATRAVTFEVAELVTAEATVFRKIASAGIPILQASNKNRLKVLIDEFNDFAPGLVAGEPGWLTDHCYVFGDGTVATGGDLASSPIVVFAPHEVFKMKGTLQGWQDSFELIDGNPLMQAVLSYGLVPVLLRFAPADFTNPIVELVMPPESGKTSLLRAVASIWGGDPSSDIGAAVSLNTTIEALDRHREARKDGLLALDEMNFAGKKNAPEFLHSLAFRLASTTLKSRFGEGEPVQSRVATLITANKPLADFLPASEARDAVKTRIASLVFDGTALQSASPRLSLEAATNQIVDWTNQDYGSAGKAFVQWLLKFTPQSPTVRALIESRLRVAQAKLRGRCPEAAARLVKIFALQFVAAGLGTESGVLPPSRDNFQDSVMWLFDHVTSGANTPKTFAQRILSYIEENTSKLRDVSLIDTKLNAASANEAAGFTGVERGRRFIVIPSLVFQATFPDYEAGMREMKKLGKAKTEMRTLTVKLSKKITDNNSRGYFIYLT